MEIIYDKNDKKIGHSDNNTVYDKNHKVIGYINCPVLYDADCNPIGYIEDNVIYNAYEMPIAYFNNWDVCDMDGNKLGHVHSTTLGLFAAGLLLGFVIGGFNNQFAYY